MEFHSSSPGQSHWFLSGYRTQAVQSEWRSPWIAPWPKYRHTSFYCASFYSILQILHFFFNKLKVGGNPTLSKSISIIFATAFACHMSVCHTLIILLLFQTFSSLLCLLRWKWSLMLLLEIGWRLRWWLTFLAIRNFYIKVCTSWLKVYRCCTLHSLLRSVDITFIGTRKAQNSCAHFLAIFTLLWALSLQDLLQGVPGIGSGVSTWPK